MLESTKKLDQAMKAYAAAHPDFDEYVVLKSFKTGYSDSEVHVVAHRLPQLPSNQPGYSLPDWSTPLFGTPTLVKVGLASKLNLEYERYEMVVKPRSEPFMAGWTESLSFDLDSEASQGVNGQPGAEKTQKCLALIGPFLGGKILRALTLEQHFSTTSSEEKRTQAIRSTYALLGPWHSANEVRSLGYWEDVVRPQERAAFYEGLRASKGKLGNWELSGSFDLRLTEGRAVASEMQSREGAHCDDPTPLGFEDWRQGLRGWDLNFATSDRRKSWFKPGPDGDCFMDRLLRQPVKFGMTHGDLHLRNVLFDGQNSWLIDWSHAGFAPILCDFAKLEVYARLSLLPVASAAGESLSAGRQFEEVLLEHFAGVESSLGEIAKLAKDLNCSVDELAPVAEIIGEIRKQALPYCLPYPDHRDYLAVLLMVLLRDLKHTKPVFDMEVGGKETARFARLTVLAEVIEDHLRRIYRFPTMPLRSAKAGEHHIIPFEALAPLGAAGKVKSWVAGSECVGVIETLRSCKGIEQGRNHHLDVFHHTLLALQFMESILDNPQSLGRPKELDQAVHRELERQGITVADPSFWLSEDLRLSDDQLPRVAEALGSISEEIRLGLKWVVLLHDIGKKDTRVLDMVDSRAPKLRFLGHESMSVAFSKGFLSKASPARADLLLYLIFNHHWGHNFAPLLLQNKLDQRWTEQLKDLKSGIKSIQGLEDCLHASKVSPEQAAGLLLLLSLVDSAASRGPAVSQADLRARWAPSWTWAAERLLTPNQDPGAET